MAIYIFNPEKLLIGKLSKRACKPFNILNDRIIIEKNLKNLLKLKLLYSDYVDEEGKTIADTIAIDNTNILYLIGYKKNAKDNFLSKYRKQYEKLVETKEVFLERVKIITKKDDIYIDNFRAILIASNFTPQEIKKSTEFPIPCDLYTWSYIGNIIIFKQCNEKIIKKWLSLKDNHFFIIKLKNQKHSRYFF